MCRSVLGNIPFRRLKTQILIYISTVSTFLVGSSAHTSTVGTRYVKSYAHYFSSRNVPLSILGTLHQQQVRSM